MKRLNPVRAIILAGGLLLQLSTLCSPSRGAPGDLGLSFDPGSGVDGVVHAVVMQPDGKLIIGGEFTTVQGLVRANVARLNADGSSDSTFTAGHYGVPSGAVYALALQSDGKILVGHRYGIARLDSDGSLDPNFNADISSEYYPAVVNSIAIQSDGKVLIGGAFATATGVNVNFGIARLDSNGTVDTSFVARTNIYGTVHSIALQADGNVLVGAEIGTGPNQSFARLEPDGNLDDRFATGTGVNASVYCVGVQSNGKVLVGGDFTMVNGTNRNRIARFNADGSLDITFNPGLGVAGSVYSAVNSLAVQSDGKVLIGGFFTTVDGTNRNRIARLNADGTLDGSFNPGPGADSDVESVIVQSDGKVLIGGYFAAVNGTNRNRIARLNADGSVDGSFQPSTGINGAVSSLMVQPDGKALIQGGFTFVDDAPRHGIARLNADGRLDSSFTPDTGTNSHVNSAALQPDGKVLIGTGFTAIDGTPSYKVARLNSDGTLDGSFYPLIGANASVSSVVRQSDGKVLIVIGSKVARLNADGALDGSFNSSPMDAYALKIAAQPDGKVIVGANTAYLTSDPEYGDYYIYSYLLARLNADGSLDSSFQHTTGSYSTDPAPQLRAIALQPDGKVLIAGAFSTANGSGIARLISNGILDGSFRATAGSVDSLLVQPDGKILIGGEFTSVAGTDRNRIARLNANGRLDKLFNPGTGPNAAVLSIAFQSAGKVLIGGAFTIVDGELRSYIARLDASDGQPNAAPTVSISGPAGSSNFAAPATIAITVNASDPDGTIAQVDVYAGATFIGSATSAPFEITWNGAATGDYAITAYATDDLGATSTSAPVSISVTAFPPAAPSGLAAKGVSPGRIKLRWSDDATNELGFKIERSTNGKPFKEIATVGAEVTTFVNSELSPGKKYAYRVRAYNTMGDSPYSNTARAKTPLPFLNSLPF